MLAMPQREERSLRVHLRKMILDNLAYPMLPKRYESVTDAHPETFKWASRESTGGNASWPNLATWLKNRNGLYWISGKPGSGKSTLTKHIYDDDRTRLYLSDWTQTGMSTSIPLTIAIFFFWNSGTSEQKSQVGMLRAHLFKSLKSILT